MSSEHVIAGNKLGKQRPNLALSCGSSFNDNDDDDDYHDDHEDHNDYEHNDDKDNDHGGPYKLRLILDWNLFQ